MSASPTIPGHDVIGDVHGMAHMLERLLTRLGYVVRDGVWGHPTRTAVFLGDIIDRGPAQLQSCGIVRRMVEAGTAQAVAGNHDWNAVAYHSPNGRGGHLRDRNQRNAHQHRAFIDAVGLDTPLHAETTAWLATLPLWLDLGGIRVVHACWDERSLDVLRPLVLPGNLPSEEILRRGTSGTDNALRPDGSVKPVDPVFHAVETILKGVEIDLPPGVGYADAEGTRRTAMRVAWWQGEGATYRSAALAPPSVREELPDLPLPSSAALGYSGDPLLFIGHYWMNGRPRALTPKVACVDYSVARAGAMVAYRWSGETLVDDANFVAVDPE
jgi:hypothetical protein